ncbi:putative Polygalacturonase [Melia azedarach]|uniref:Polygalacturonase n=1 Tax=Melia azedarach TaxID=155640 RepID=A0ACC1XL18_MELAZ|nr:putative Polygalacturonase [Melia azedarach]
MSSQKQYSLQFFVIILVSFSSSCFSSYQNYPFVYKRSFGSMSENLMSRISSRARAPVSSRNVVNVDDFRAKGDGTDDSQAFMEAWEEACSSDNEAVLIVPRHKIYHLKPVTFSGPCKSDLTMKIYGTIKATVRVSDYNKDPRHWLVFQNVNNLRVEGGGTINGNGKIWWRQSCKVNTALAITFDECNNLRVGSLRFRNSQQMHLSFQNCVNVEASNLRIYAPGNSPNTDGIHVTGTQNIQIKNCVIRTGDDCISIVSGSRNVRATDIICGPGHGISIGSLGAGNSEAFVSNVMVDRARLSGTTNGMRIKTWQGGSGYARNIIFQNIMMYNVSNPIIIDQHYCDQEEPCREQASAVQVSNVMYRNIKGTSASEVAIKLDCSKRHPCKGLVLQDVLLGLFEGDEIAKASCLNVNLSSRGSISPHCA